MKTFKEINALKEEGISLVTGGDGGAIYTGDPEPQQYIGGIVFVGNTPGQSGGAIING